MFGIGPVELIIIAVVALMLFSPRELPGIIRTFTKFWGSLRQTADDFRDAIMNEEELDEIKKAIKGGKDELKKAEAAARRELMKARVDMQKAQNKLLKTVKATEQAQKAVVAEAVPADGAAAAVGAGAAAGAVTEAAVMPAAVATDPATVATDPGTAMPPSQPMPPPRPPTVPPPPVVGPSSSSSSSAPPPPPAVGPTAPKVGNGVDQGAA